MGPSYIRALGGRRVFLTTVKLLILNLNNMYLICCVLDHQVTTVESL
jgi:hypothetical protein